MAATLSPADLRALQADVARALAEDLESGDATADLLADEPQQAFVICKDENEIVLAGGPWFEACFRALDPGVRIDWRVQEGQRLSRGTVACTITGRSRAIVSAERPALNFLQTLSATATVTARHVAAVAGTRTRILDTRKTLPGLRRAQKYAVRVGGGDNHRMGLFDAVMLKENHILAHGSIAAAAARARELHPELPLIVEVENLDELDQAIAAGCTRILIDEFSPDDRREAVRRAAGKVPLEVSGGISLARVAEIAADGVDCISIGALTKHVQAADYSLRMGVPAGD